MTELAAPPLADPESPPPAPVTAVAADDAVALADSLLLMGICGLWLG
jgi:hypothetical protein